jgi:hypothetical protein
MRFISIDLGLQGGLASVTDTGIILATAKMPLREDGSVDAYEVMLWIAQETADALESQEGLVIGMERLHAIFMSSAASTFTFGLNIGKVHGAMECLELPITEVRAVDWQNYLFTILDVPEMGEVKGGRYKRSTKDMAAWARDILWPTNELPDHDGITDALLISEYLRRLSLESKEVH